MKARDERAAWAYAERLIAIRPRTVAELERRLVSRGFAPDLVRRVVDRAHAAGLVDDRLFACLYAEDRLLSRPCARRLIVKELRDHGVDAPLAEEAAQAAFPELPEEELAHRALVARLPLWQGLPRDAVERRAAAFLLRRGFAPSLAKAVIKETLHVGRSLTAENAEEATE
ncbi:regulatory protein RecX [Candidatus Bipolaricaulota bacterium]|nr:regulatory protein RecX [Candidatus Bipolaricaulota bacterium]